VGGQDADGRRRVLRHQRVDLGIGTPWVVVEQRELPGVGALGQRDRVLDGRVAEKAQARQFGRGVLRIVHHEVGAFAQGDRCIVVYTGAIWAGAEGGRAVIGKISQGGGTVADPVAERTAAFVRDLPSVHREALELIVPGLDGVERPAIAQLLGPDREMRRRDRPGQ
jgi:hypothetical protein